MNGQSFRDTVAVAAAWEGEPLNYSRMGKQLNISALATKSRLQQLAEAGIIWLLHPLDVSTLPTPSPRAKVRKSPKLYLQPSARSLLLPGEIPGRVNIRFLSRMIRRVRDLEATRHPSSTFWYYGGYGKTHVELIVQTAVKRIGFVFLDQNRLSRWCWSYCKRVFKQGILQGAFVLYPGHRIFFAADRIVVLPAEEFCSRYRRWMNACLGSSRKLLLRMVRTYNTTHAEHLS